MASSSPNRPGGSPVRGAPGSPASPTATSPGNAVGGVDPDAVDYDDVEARKLFKGRMRPEELVRKWANEDLRFDELYVPLPIRRMLLLLLRVQMLRISRSLFSSCTK